MSTSRQSNEYRFNVFINCPFDSQFTKIFHSIIFTTIYCGFKPRCTLESTDFGITRMRKIYDIISECGLAIHDISKFRPHSHKALPRFNMPLELGIFLGAKEFGKKKKNVLS
ncbi:metal-dependent hydrolases of the beta-lactamase superfamily I [Candidatus Scalindua japonica]|uniref:Metal-dependent hydrolases of the beta-lactamase superfamily I n=1 Tax=Candidatus Scalindua japonica TaxID=1284222 RepID=A0A286TWX9_9BACT|nr:hypothetical protein [Candidatus Scalindua japonica]GAX60393.1 metal-dependent hydrolases of the beta-lactamase superfamily I [Candidatus Scalindua japonica]